MLLWKPSGMPSSELAGVYSRIEVGEAGEGNREVFRFEFGNPYPTKIEISHGEYRFDLRFRKYPLPNWNYVPEGYRFLLNFDEGVIN